MSLSRCPECGADYPFWYSRRNSFETLCENFGYSSEENDDREQ